MRLALIEQLKTWHGQPSIIETYQERQSPAELIAVGSNISLFPCRFFFHPLPYPNFCFGKTHTHAHSPHFHALYVHPPSFRCLDSADLMWSGWTYFIVAEENKTMRAYCGGSWRCQEDTEEEREVGGVEGKKIFSSQNFKSIRKEARSQPNLSQWRSQ